MSFTQKDVKVFGVQGPHVLHPGSPQCSGGVAEGQRRPWMELAGGHWVRGQKTRQGHGQAGAQGLTGDLISAATDQNPKTPTVQNRCLSPTPASSTSSLIQQLC